MYGQARAVARPERRAVGGGRAPMIRESDGSWRRDGRTRAMALGPVGGDGGKCRRPDRISPDTVGRWQTGFGRQEPRRAERRSLTVGRGHDCPGYRKWRERGLVAVAAAATAMRAGRAAPATPVLPPARAAAVPAWCRECALVAGTAAAGHEPDDWSQQQFGLRPTGDRGTPAAVNRWTHASIATNTRRTPVGRLPPGVGRILGRYATVRRPAMTGSPIRGICGRPSPILGVGIRRQVDTSRSEGASCPRSSALKDRSRRSICLIPVSSG